MIKKFFVGLFTVALIFAAGFGAGTYYATPEGKALVDQTAATAAEKAKAGAAVIADKATETAKAGVDAAKQKWQGQPNPAKPAAN